MCGRIGPCLADAFPRVYLAAGEGKRLRPLTADRPKAMVEIDGIALAERALRSLRGAGVERDRRGHRLPARGARRSSAT